MNMKIRVTEKNGILKLHIRELVRAARERKDDMGPPMWRSEENDDDFFIPPPVGHDPQGRNRR